MTSHNLILQQDQSVQKHHIGTISQQLFDSQLQQIKNQEEIDRTLAILKNKKKTFIIDKIEFVKYPFFPEEIDFGFQIIDVIKTGIIQPRFKPLLQRFAQNKFMKKLVQHFFWLIFLQQFKKNKSEDVIIELRKQISNIYTNLFICLDDPKDSNTNILIFTIGYVINHIFYNAFSNYRHMFNKQFNLNTYHTVIREIYGINLSDLYMFKNFVNMFNMDFFLLNENNHYPQLKEIHERNENRKQKQIYFENMTAKTGKSVNQSQRKSSQFNFNESQMQQNYSITPNYKKKKLGSLSSVRCETEKQVQFELLRIKQNSKNQKLKSIQQDQFSSKSQINIKQYINQMNVLNCDQNSPAFQDGLKIIKFQKKGMNDMSDFKQESDQAFSTNDQLLMKKTKIAKKTVILEKFQTQKSVQSQLATQDSQDSTFRSQRLITKKTVL